MAARIEVADEVAKAVFELEPASAVGPRVVDDEHAEILECALEDAPAALPRRAGKGKLVEGVGAPRDTNVVDPLENVVERGRRRGWNVRSVAERRLHLLRVYAPGVG